MKSIITSISNGKGGVGKTTVTCNLGHAITRCGLKVLVIDMDPQGNTTSLLIPDSKINYSLYEHISSESKTPIEKCIHATFVDNLWCIPNVNETSGLEPELIRNQDFDTIKRIRPFIQANYDFCIIDCPPNMGTWVITALTGSDFVIVPNLANSTFSIDGLLNVMTLIDKIREEDNPDLKFLRLLINQVDKRKSISKFNIGQIKQHFPADKIFETRIPTNAPFETAEANNTTIFKEAPTSSGCKAYRSLAKEILDIFNIERHKNGKN